MVKGKVLKRAKPKPGQLTGEDFRDARIRAGLTQRDASLMLFGPDSSRTIENWEAGVNQVPKSMFVLLLLMTKQISVAEALAIVEKHKQARTRRSPRRKG